MRGKSGHMLQLTSAAVMCIAALPFQATAQLTLDQFADCIGPNSLGDTTGTCTLQYSSSAYQIDPSLSFYSSTSGKPLQVTRSYITVNGAGTWPNTPTLQRAVFNQTPFTLMNITGTNVTVQNLIIDGNRFGPSGLNCLSSGYWVDLDGTNAPHLKVQYMQFRNAPGFALVLPATTAPTSQNDVYVYNSLFQTSRNVAIYARDNNVVNYNTLQYSGINAVQTSGSGQLIEYNTFYQNHDEWWAMGSTGGQLIIYADNSNVQVIDNTFDGNSVYCPAGGCSPQGCYVNVGANTGTGGIEHYGANGTFTNNEIKNHYGGGGIGSGSSINGLTINGIDPGFTPYWIHDNGAGISFLGTGSGTWTFTNLRSIHNTNNSGAQYGVYLPGSGTTINWGLGACLTGNTDPQYNLGPGWTAPPSTNYNCP